MELVDLADHFDVELGNMLEWDDVSKAVTGADTAILTEPLVFDAPAMDRMGRNVFAGVIANDVGTLIYNASTTTPDQETSSPVIEMLRRLAKGAAALDVERPSLGFRRSLII